MTKKQKILNKIKYPLEFLISMVFVISFIEIFLTKSYYDVLLVQNIVISAISGAMLLAIIILIFKFDKDKFENIVISLLIPIGMFYVFFMVPTQVPDEATHIRRAIDVSNGAIVGKPNIEVPEDFADNSWITDYSTVKELLNEDTNYNESEEVQSFANGNLPVPYTFSAIGFKIGKIFSMNFMKAIYLARILNYIVFLCVAHISIKRIPFGKLIVAVFCFMPMVLQQCASISADAIIIELALLFVVETLYLKYTDKPISKFEYAIYGLIAIFLTPLKFVYLPIIGISLLLIGNKNISKKCKIITITSVIILSALACGLWYLITIGDSFTSEPERNESFEVGESVVEVNPSEQLSFILHNPFKYLSILVSYIIRRGGGYLKGMIGSPLGWLDVFVDGRVILCFLVLLLLSPILEKNEYELSIKEKIFILFLVLAVCGLVFTVYYLVGAEVGGSEIFGCQGRYFIPVFILPLLCLVKKKFYLNVKGIYYIIPIILFLLNIWVDKIIFFEYF